MELLAPAGNLDKLKTAVLYGANAVYLAGQKFSLRGRVAIITGGAGLLGIQHAEAIAEAGGIPILWDINAEASSKEASSDLSACENQWYNFKTGTSEHLVYISSSLRPIEKKISPVICPKNQFL